MSSFIFYYVFDLFLSQPVRHRLSLFSCKLWSQQRRHHVDTHVYVCLCVYIEIGKLRNVIKSVYWRLCWRVSGIFDQQTRSNSLTSVSEACTEKREQKLNRKCKCKEIKNVLSLFILRQTLTHTHTHIRTLPVCVCVCMCILKSYVHFILKFFAFDCCFCCCCCCWSVNVG